MSVALAKRPNMRQMLPAAKATMSTSTTTTGEQLPEVQLVVGHAAWWRDKPTTKNRHTARAQNFPFVSALKDFLQNVSFHCYGKLVEQRRSFQEHFFWFVFHATSLTILIAFLWTTCVSGDKALVTTIYDPNYPISKVPFPTVSICSLNRMSNVSVTRYARQLSAKDPRNRTVNFFYENLKMLVYHYYRMNELNNYERALWFQGFLDTYDTEGDELFYNTRSRMHMLTPNCSDMFVQCRLAGEIFDCMQEFQETLTSQGYCCTFNHDGKYNVERSYRQRLFGIDMGLSLTLKTNSSDDFHKIYTLDGFLVSIYAQHSYPDPYSGAIEERFAQTGVQSLLPITTKLLETVPEARYMHRTERNCLFENEMPRIFARRYSFNMCISACRTRSIVILCECVPFASPDHYSGSITGRVFCTLQHLECLKRYEFKWLNVITSRANVTGLEHEMEDALYCPECLPSCTETQYKVKGAMVLSLNSRQSNANNTFRRSNDAELALLRIYFAETHIQYFRQYIKNSWYEDFGKIGNICGIIAGFSLIGIAEVLFFLGKQLWHACKTEIVAERNNRRGKRTKKHMALIILP